MSKKSILRGFALATPVWVVLVGHLMAQSTTPYDLPNDNTGCPGNCREIPWQAGSDLWNNGTLPNYSSVTCNKLAGNGTTDDGPAIQACLNALSSGQCALIPAGHYLINSTVRLVSNTCLRGAKAEGGPPFMPTVDTGATTIILGSNTSITTQNFSSGAGNLDPAITYAVNSPGYNIGNAPHKGDTTFTIGSGTLTAGQWISVFADNDPTLVSSVGTDGTCNWCGENTGYRTQIQILQVTNVTGTTATISRPFYYTLYTHPEYRKYTFPTQKAGLENLRFDGSKADIGATPIILLQGCLYCWVKNVETYDTGSSSGSAHIEMDYGYGDEVRDSALHDQRSGASGSGYGVYFQFANTDAKVENNIIFHNRHGVVYQGGGSGTAILYNYIDDAYTDDLSYLGSARTSHGAHPFFNLWEGNIASHVAADDFWGTSSHFVFFRNWLWGGESNAIYSGGIGIPSFPPINGYDAIDVYTGQTYYSFVGNVLGNPSLATNANWSAATLRGFDEYAEPTAPIVYSYGGTLTLGGAKVPSSGTTSLNHGNYDYKTKGVAYWEGGTNHTLKTSMYYTSKPAFLGTCVWPGIGPDVSGLTDPIPAINRFNSTSCSGISPAAPTGLTAAPH
jgi:hypothetical protein